MKTVQRRPVTVLLLAVLCVIMVVCSVLIVRDWPQPLATPSTIEMKKFPLQAFNGDELARLQLPEHKKILSAQKQSITLLPLNGEDPLVLATPGYRFSRSFPPILTPTQEVLYAGAGIWLTSLNPEQEPRKLVTLAEDEVLTSLALSPDGRTIAWSTAPKNGNGFITLYKQPLAQSAEDAQPEQLYQTKAFECPCFRIFAFAPKSNTILLLTNDRGDQRAIAYGLWSLSFAQNASAKPQALLPDAALQKPLALSPQGDQLLYSSFAGLVPAPQIATIPGDISSINYANSLLTASITSNQQKLQPGQTIVSEQRDQTDTSAYQWIMTPCFSPTGQNIAYVGFASDHAPPFARQYALYITPTNAQGSAPKLLAPTTAGYTEIGGWMDEHTLIVYADNAWYGLDTQTGAIAQIIRTGAYAHFIAVIE